MTIMVTLANAERLRRLLRSLLRLMGNPPFVVWAADSSVIKAQPWLRQC